MIAVKFFSTCLSLFYSSWQSHGTPGLNDWRKTHSIFILSFQCHWENKSKKSKQVNCRCSLSRHLLSFTSNELYFCPDGWYRISAWPSGLEGDPFDTAPSFLKSFMFSPTSNRRRDVLSDNSWGGKIKKKKEFRKRPWQTYWQETRERTWLFSA